ncbi:MAG TPA: hypothetical protein VFG07_09550, partial [Thermoplasmata archaeon]|nr:hypothetical protein [Thermoplasmata archaeon]
ELQFYPDSDWNTGGPVFGSWVGAAVAWQIEAATGYENPCFYQPLALGDGSELLMTQGDQVSVTMSGWIGDPYGENLTITDLTNREVSDVNMYNAGQNYPLDPAYATTSYPNSLQWTPGGEFPVVFAYETGHTSPPFPNNNSYGGCSSGAPPSTIVDPAVPCPSYDPGSWINDTAQPWRISPPTFFNATTRERPAQVSFSQDLGGISLVDWLSNSTCVGRDGSAWCSYPWYSYSCAEQAFNFGATDYASTSVDFGGYNEYAQPFESDAAQLGFYPPTNFSIPTCGQPAYSVTVSTGSTGGGSAYFLSQAVPVNRTFGGLAAGEYALAAISLPHERFAGWSTSGGVRVADSSSPTTTLWVSADGSAVATFTSAAIPLVAVKFYTTPTSGHVVILPSLYYTNGTPIATVANLATVDLAPGTYSIQAYSPSGYNFSTWTVSGAGASVAAPLFPYTWLVIPGGSAGISVHADSVTSSSTDYVYFGTQYGQGTVSFNGGSSTSSGSASVTVGTYSLKATAASGWSLEGWYVSSSGVMSDFSPSTNLTLESGTTYVYAYFELLIQIQSSPGGGGGVSLDGGTATAVQSVFLYPYTGVYTLTPAPAAGYAFQSWSVSSGADVWVHPLGGGVYRLDVNYSASITATFVTASAVNLTFAVIPASAGAVEFNFAAYSDGAVNSTLTAGSYAISPVAAGGYNFSSWSVSGATGALSITTFGLLSVTKAGGVLTANFVRGKYPVTVVTSPPEGPSVSLSGGIPPGTTTLENSQTTWIGGGAVSAEANLLANRSFIGWAASPALNVTGGAQATLDIQGPGTLTLFAVGFGLSASVIGAARIDLGHSIHIAAVVNGSGGFTYAWQGLPVGCPLLNVASIFCTPTATGNSTVSVTVNSTDGTSRTVEAGVVEVVPDMSASNLTASPGSIDLGQTTNVSIVVANGVGPYVFQYGGLPLGCTAPDAPTFRCTPSFTGVSVVGLKVVDADGYSLTAQTSITVNALPAMSAFNESRNVTEVGLPIVYGIWATGGTGGLTFSYAGLPPGCSSLNSSTLPCAPTSVGLYTVTARATDLNGFVASRSQSLLVHPLPYVVTFAPQGWSGVVNTSLHLVLTLGGGTGPFRVAYSGLPGGCPGRNSSFLNCTPSETGNFTIVVDVSDALGQRVSAYANVSVQPPTAQSGGPPNPTPSAGGLLGIPYWVWALGFGVLVVVVGLGLAVRRRAASRGASPEDEGGGVGSESTALPSDEAGAESPSTEDPPI